MNEVHEFGLAIASAGLVFLFGLWLNRGWLFGDDSQEYEAGRNHLAEENFVAEMEKEAKIELANTTIAQEQELSDLAEQLAERDR
jgi:hypothetical protein